MALMASDSGLTVKDDGKSSEYRLSSRPYTYIAFQISQYAQMDFDNEFAYWHKACFRFYRCNGAPSVPFNNGVENG
jgi:hypothetical protein